MGKKSHWSIGHSLANLKTGLSEKQNPYGTLDDDDHHHHNSIGPNNDALQPPPPNNPICTDEPIHDKFCDGCKMDPIGGNRYTCSSCEDFDLCLSCYSSIQSGTLSHEPSHKFEEQAPVFYDMDCHISEVLVRSGDFVEGIIFRRTDTNRLFYGHARGLESDPHSQRFVLQEGEYIIRYGTV